MPTIYIPDTPTINVTDKALFGLTRPFRFEGKWCINTEMLKRWELENMKLSLTGDIHKATMCLLPYPVNVYFNLGFVEDLHALNTRCQEARVKAYGFIDGDSGKKYMEFSNITYFRAGGSRSQLNENYRGFPVFIPDQLGILYGRSAVFERPYMEKPVIGFCGHASLSWVKRIKESTGHVIENAKRVVVDPFRSDWEPVFPSAYHRALIMAQIRQSDRIAANFISRDEYRAGYESDEERDETTKEYFENMKYSDYVLCVRGGGNFSVRFYEALMMGRIPVLVNTDSILPFPEHIDWPQHIVNIAWHDRYHIANEVLKFHSSLGPEGFVDIQHRNRRLWRDRLSLKGILEILIAESHKNNDD